MEAALGHEIAKREKVIVDAVGDSPHHGQSQEKGKKGADSDLSAQAEVLMVMATQARGDFHCRRGTSSLRCDIRSPI
jgi:hypothetical protein